MFSTSIDGKKFLLPNVLKDLRSKRRMIVLRSWLKSIVVRNGHLLPSICLVELEGKAGRGKQCYSFDLFATPDMIASLLQPLEEIA
ncbi:hypothetical protein CTI12_AA268520 [Artemisia annua]|uniref:Uncharacterized protein n=1 Tax=Artemisia annua TaxID=35608 RepID=A0A2U1NG31_ARTAN|nr:hypothetical protein CTI12_AA268520 [Artemisia annua]